jgi:flagellar motor switch protein FliN/FliY
MSQDSQAGRGQVTNPDLDVLLDIELPVTLRFGDTSLSLGEVMALTSGSLIEFNRALDDPVEVRVNGRVVAHGQVVTVQGNYGIRITEVANRFERLDTTSRLVP